METIEQLKSWVVSDITPAHAEEIRCRFSAKCLSGDIGDLADAYAAHADKTKITYACFRRDLLLGTAEALRIAKVVLWRSDLWDSAVSGYELFKEKPLPTALFPTRPEFHVLTKPRVSDTGNKSYCGSLLIPWIDSGTQIPALSVTDFFVPIRENIYVMLHETPSLRLSYWLPFKFINTSLHAILAFLKTKYVSVQQHKFNRAERRRANHRHATLPDIHIVYLRQRAVNGEPAEHHQVDWQCQWRVSGHWRNQWHPSTGERTPTYIGEYVKGPPDKPLKPVSKHSMFYVTH